jgi:hypothetical protein
MKTLRTLLLFFVLMNSNLYGQYVPPTNSKEKPPKDNSDEVVEEKNFFPAYLGFGTGLYSKYGFIGLSSAIRLSEKNLAELNIGRGGWGTKMGFSFTTFARNRKSWCPSIGFTRNFGGHNIPLTAEVQVNGTDLIEDLDLLHHFLPVNIIHLTVQRQILSYRGNRIIFEMGYSLPLSKPEVIISGDSWVVVDGKFIPIDELSYTEAQELQFRIQAPNGILLSFAYQFGLGKGDF